MHRSAMLNVAATAAVMSLTLNGVASRADTLLFSDTFDSENSGKGQFNYAGFGQWDVTSGTVDLIGSPGVGDFYPGHGLYVDLDGSPGRGRMESKNVFDLAPGLYRLSFEIGNNPFLGTILQHNHARVSLADAFSEDFSRDGVTALDPVSRLISVTSPTSGRLVFESLDPTDFAGVVIDDVRLDYIPEPATASLAIATVGLALLLRSRKSKHVPAALLAMFVACPAAHAAHRVHTLVPYELSDSRFGLTGTITTDGSIGIFSIASFITDWSITVNTPSDVDGVSTEVFTPASGPAFAYRGSESLEVTSDTITILEPEGSFAARPVLSLGTASVETTAIIWSGAYTSYPQPAILTTYSGRWLPGNVGIIDHSEDPFRGYFFSLSSSFLVATDGVSLPEPTSLALICVGSVLLFRAVPLCS